MTSERIINGFPDIAKCDRCRELEIKCEYHPPNVAKGARSKTACLACEKLKTACLIDGRSARVKRVRVATEADEPEPLGTRRERMLGYGLDYWKEEYEKLSEEHRLLKKKLKAGDKLWDVEQKEWKDREKDWLKAEKRYRLKELEFKEKEILGQGYNNLLFDLKEKADARIRELEQELAGAGSSGSGKERDDAEVTEPVLEEDQPMEEPPAQAQETEETAEIVPESEESPGKVEETPEKAVESEESPEKARETEEVMEKVQEQEKEKEDEMEGVE